MTRAPDNLDDFRAAVLRCANKILDEVPDTIDGWPILERMVETINRQPGRWRIVSKVDFNNGTWEFDVVPRGPRAIILPGEQKV